MKLKKILSGFLAAAMAVTTMVTASAAPAEDTTIVSNVSITSGVYDATGGCEVAFAGCNWSGTWMCDDYGTLEMTFSASDWGNAKCIALVINSGDDLNDANQGTTYVQQTSWSADTGKKTYRIDCSQYAGKGFNFIGYKVYRNDGSSDTNFNGNITIESVVLKAKDTVEYANQVISNPPMGEILPGVFDASKVNGSSAKMIISWTSTDSNNGIQIQNEAGETLTSFSGWGETGPVTKEVLLSDFTLPNKIKLNAWGISSIESLTISNDKTKGNVYSEGASTYTITIDSTIEHGTVTADKEEAEEDDTVILTVTPATGYELDTLTVADADGSPVTVAEDNSFTMPASNVTVSAAFKTAEVALTGIELNKTAATVVVGKTVTLTATKKPANTTDETAVTFESDAPAVASVDAATGVVTGVSAGSAKITAKCGTATAECNVTVTADAKPCTAITLNKTAAEVKKGESVTLTATVAPADTTDEITWTTSDAAVASVASDGKVTGAARGTATITATCGDMTAECEVSVVEDKTVTPPVSVGGQKNYDVVTTVGGKEVKTVDTVYAISEADLSCKGYKVTITNTANGKSITKEITDAYKKVTVPSAENLGNDTFAGYYLVVRVKNVPKDVTLTYSFEKIS